MTDELKIVSEATNTPIDKIIVNDIGWTSRVYIIDNGRIVFKFPRTNEDKNAMNHEVQSLWLIKDVDFGIKVPIINWAGQNNEYIGFYGVIGISFFHELKSLGDDQKRNAGRDIGLFLRKLHSLTPPDDAYMMTIADEITEYQEKYQKSLNVIQAHVSEDNQRKIKDLFMQEMPTKISALGDDVVFCHGDLGVDNVLIDDETIGAIDFGDAGKYDRSKDFIVLADDDVLLDSVLEVYGDYKGLREKIAIRQKVLPVLDLLYYISKGDQGGIMKQIREIERRLEKNDSN